MSKPWPWANIFFWIFLAGWLASTALVVAGFEPPAPWRWAESLFPLLAALAVLGALAQRVPAQNAVAIAFIVLVMTGGIVTLGAISGIPFGVIWFREHAGPLLFDRLPAWSPLWWLAILVSSRETGRLIMQSHRKTRSYGIWILYLGTLLAVVTDLSWEVYGVRVRSLWMWQSSEKMLCWHGTPWVNFVGWVAVSVVTLGFCIPWFINKRPAGAVSRLTPALLWALINLHFIIGSASRGWWLGAGVGLVLTGLATVLAWKGWREVAKPQPASSPLDK